MRRAQLVVALLTAMITNSALAYSNVLFLGDSLSDIGNFPQATNIYEPSYDDLAQHAFIPVTNPVSTAQGKMLTIDGETFSYPIPDNPSYLQAMPPLEGHARHYRSINWSQFFNAELFQDQGSVIPSMQIAKGVDAYGKNKSVNYAWWGTVTGEGCYDQNYHLIQTHCNVSELEAKRYSSNIDNILIPGLLSQVTILQNDINQHHIYHDNDTLYVLFAGGNGLYQAQTNIETGSLKKIWYGVKLLHGAGAHDISKAISQLRKAPSFGKHFLVINLHNLSLTPRVVNDNTLGLFTSLFSNAYNKQLNNAISSLKKTNPDLDIQEFDNYHFFEKLSKSDFFKDSLGKQCDGHDSHSPYYQSEASPDNCMIDKNHGYLYWNNSHPSGLTHALLARAVKKQLLS